MAKLRKMKDEIVNIFTFKIKFPYATSFLMSIKAIRRHNATLSRYLKNINRFLKHKKSSFLIIFENITQQLIHQIFKTHDSSQITHPLSVFTSFPSNN